MVSPVAMDRHDDPEGGALRLEPHGTLHSLRMLVRET